MRIGAVGSLVASTLTAGCVGYIEGWDFSYKRSNCFWVTSFAYYDAGYDIFHQRPEECPWGMPVRSPWAPVWTDYSAVITGPENSAFAVYTDIYNYNARRLVSNIDYFEDAPVGTRALPQGQYPGGEVPVAAGEQKYDLAESRLSDDLNRYARVYIDYEGTRVGLQSSMGPTVNEGQSFTLTASPTYLGAIGDPAEYRWYKDGQLVDGPSSSNSYTTSLWGSGYTAVFKVEVSDAAGTSMSKTWITVPATCGNPPCAPQ